MENRQQQILAEIQSMMASIRNELNMLDVKISEFQQIAAGAGNELEPIDLEPIEFTMEAPEIEVVQPELEIEPEVEVEIEVEPEVELVVEEVEAEPEVVVEEVVEDLPVEEDDDLPFFEEESVFAEPEPGKVEPVKEEPAALIDAMLDKLAWKKDMPGSAVKDVRSAISLNDRILFINKLFAEDPMAFQSAIVKLNSMESLDQVVDYINTEHSDWNLESDTVYRFMMAVRRKVK